MYNLMLPNGIIFTFLVWSARENETFIILALMQLFAERAACTCTIFLPSFNSLSACSVGPGTKKLLVE